MEMTQMNIRIPADLKREGESLLAQWGVSASEVMRSVWTYMVEHKELPPTMSGYAEATGAPDAAKVQSDLDRARQGAQAISRFYEQAGYKNPTSYSKDRSALLEDAERSMLAEYEAMGAS